MNDKGLLSNLELGDDGIYGYSFENKDQADEIELRESVAHQVYNDYLLELSKHHSIPVMDQEIKLFLKGIPENGTIIDVGGCWGWHWRELQKLRPDVNVYIVDFIRSNLVHAKNILNDSIGRNIFLIHGDATNLAFDDDVFDGYWSVQTLQHIPDFETTIKEAYRILKNNGIFANYSLNNQWFIKLVYRLLGKKYHEIGNISGIFYLARASDTQLEIVKTYFGNNVIRRYSEIFFTPEFKVRFPGKKASAIGFIDSYLSNCLGVFSGVARQQSYHVIKDSKSNAHG